jgi:serine phosphatase RsbU (regulator of sigma subunit)
VDERHREVQRALGMTSVVVLPLKARGRILSTVTLVFTDSGRRWHDRLVDAAEALARQAGLALENARLYTERSEVARILQDSLLPSSLPDIAGVDLAVRYRAAGRTTAVGGDCYDVFCTGEQSPALLVADVVGKGAEAAALTSLVRHTLRAAYFRGEPPQLALGLVNEALIAAEIPGRFCTAIHGWVTDRHDGDVKLELASAGHPPPLVLRAGGEVETVDVSGLLLGVTRDAGFGATDVTLRPGDTMLLYTDGMTELTGIDPIQGERILREQLASLAGRSAREIVEGVERRALLEAKGEMRDDIALLALQATAT